MLSKIIEKLENVISWLYNLLTDFKQGLNTIMAELECILRKLKRNKIDKT